MEVKLKNITIEFIRPVNVNGNVARYHTYNNVIVCYITEQTLDLRFEKFAFRCPLSLIRYLQFNTDNEREVPYHTI